MTEAIASATIAPRPANSAWSNVLAIGQRELRDALRSRWFLLYSLAFVALGLGVAYLSAAASGAAGMASFGRTTAGLVNLVLLVVPLMALTAGAGTIASDRERGMLLYLLAQPVTRFEVLMGKYLGLALALLASICLGFGVCAAILAAKGSTVEVGRVLQLCGLSFALALSMLGIGLLISAVCRRASVAMGVAVFVWLLLVFVSDLGLMAGTMALHLSIEQVFALAMANPLQVFKMWSLHAVDTSLDVLGPVGLYADDTFGAWMPWLFGGVMLVWAAIPMVAASILFARRPAS